MDLAARGFPSERMPSSINAYEVSTVYIADAMLLL